jgi:DNA-binding IclR family transcriptional regulator
MGAMGDGQGMNNRKLQLYEIITIWPICYGYLATVRKLARACGLTQAEVRRGLAPLVAAGLVTRVSGVG